MNVATRITLVRITLILIFMFIMSPGFPWSAHWVSGNTSVLNDGHFIGILAFFISTAISTLDGYIARKRKEVTKLGKFLDSLTNKVSIISGLLFLVQTHQISSFLAMIVISAEIIITAFKTIAVAEGVTLIVNRIDNIRFPVQIFAILVMMFGGYSIRFITPPPIDTSVMLIAVLLTIYSTAAYFRRNIKATKVLFK
ncbi:CDP-alcohol phosphatidyltransferase family protein [Aneurinibacillus terranovensis]|uniref:CDP-alcohol phosphatidyltransferase family protein n=1 Tax=Aneurinibacillus terranovensis TaxID=278991 RepID=UPI000482C6E7|nr:CDP-alcohol phosphatidyltransferase family protein [Aneurinibacillus terranovensis]